MKSKMLVALLFISHALEHIDLSVPQLFAVSPHLDNNLSFKLSYTVHCPILSPCSIPFNNLLPAQLIYPYPLAESKYPYHNASFHLHLHHPQIIKSSILFLPPIINVKSEQLGTKNWFVCDSTCYLLYIQILCFLWDSQFSFHATSGTMGF